MFCLHAARTRASISNYTCYPSAGEDYPCGGRLLLFEVTRENGARTGVPGQEKWKLVKKYVR
jgi:hypothetical protein